MLAFSIVGKIAFNLSGTGFYACLAMAVIFSINAGLNIGIKSEIRHALIAIGCVNWLGAVDFMLWPDRITYVYLAYPYLINLLDLFIIYHLFFPGYGGGKIAKIHNNRLGWHYFDGLFGGNWGNNWAANLSRNFTFSWPGVNLCKSKESATAKANRT